jgi:hypothetical protein
MKMKKLVLVLSVFMLGFFLISCGPTREQSGNLHEKAIIVNYIYSPSRHDTHIGTTMMNDFNNPLGGIDMNGDRGIVIGKVAGQTIQISSSTVPEQYGVVFQCQHGTFTVQGPNNEGQVSKYKILHDKLMGHMNDTVDVIYQEVYDVTYEKNKEGQKVETNRVLVDLDFIDAQLVN